MSEQIGVVTWINGPVVRARGSRHIGMLELVEVGEERLVGEVIGLDGDIITAQVYEETSGMQTGAPIFGTGLPLSVELGPGLIQSIYDGVQRPLPLIEAAVGSFITRGARFDPISREKKWKYTPKVNVGDEVKGGAILGVAMETETFEHRVMLHPDDAGTITWVASAGEYTVIDPIAKLKMGKEEKTITMLQRWPVRRARPFIKRRGANIPLITGQRILDTFFPVAKGGAAGIPGPFGSGKTVTQHSIAKWADAEVIVYIGCGERGNEMTEVLQEFPHLIDPRSGRPLMERTVLIANTSNMPVAAREASIYTGITIAEYYRDMGYHVALMADSTSRWAEAMREISSRLEEMPGEEAFPAYLSAKLSDFYERAGRATALNGREGSVSVIGAVSPSGGDFSEPVTQGTLRIVKVFWGLDTALRAPRHFPAVNWLISYSLYVDTLEDWYRKNVSDEWPKLRAWVSRTLQEEAELEEIVRLVGGDALPEDQQLTLDVSRLIREVVLQQNAYHKVDTFCPPERTFRIVAAVKQYSELSRKALALEVPLKQITGIKSRELLTRVKYEENFDDELKRILAQMEDEMKKLGA